MTNLSAAPTTSESLKVPLMHYVERMDKSFYHYEGSLTTPPCSERVQFIVMKEIQYITFADIKLFQGFWGSNKKFANGRGNNRITQPINGRPIYFKDVTLEERYAELTNHFMMPDGAAMGGLSVLGLVIGTFMVFAIY